MRFDGSTIGLAVTGKSHDPFHDGQSVRALRDEGESITWDSDGTKLVEEDAALLTAALGQRVNLGALHTHDRKKCCIGNDRYRANLQE